MAAGIGNEVLGDIPKKDVLLFQNQDYEGLAFRFLLPGHYDDKQKNNERNKLKSYIRKLADNIGGLNSFALRDEYIKIFPLSLDGGDRVGWGGLEKIEKSYFVQHDAVFTNFGDLVIETVYAKKNGIWFIYSFGVGDSDKESKKTQELTSIGMSIMQELSNQKITNR